MEDDNTKEIAEYIYTHLPQKPNKYKLGLDDPESLGYQEKEGVYEFNQGILAHITLHGIEILFGHKELLDLTEKNLELIDIYVKSYGYNLVTEVVNEKISFKFTAI